jgi:hypothetical protein
MDDGEAARELRDGGDDEAQPLSGAPAPPAMSPEERKAAIAERKRLIADVDVAAILPRLTKYAIRRRRDHNEAKAEEHASEALARGWDPDYPAWDREKEPDVFRYFQSIVNGIIHNDERLAENEGEHATVRDAAPLEWQRSKAATPEQLANLRGMLERCKKLVVARFGERALVFMRSACETGEDQAGELGLTALQLRHFKSEVYEYCRQFAAQLDVDGRGFERRVVTPEQRALEAAIRKTLPFWARWWPTLSAVGGLLLLVLAIGAVVSLFYFNPLGRKK